MKRTKKSEYMILKVSAIIAVGIVAFFGITKTNQEKYVPVVEKVMPSVVEIRVVGLVPNPLAVLIDDLTGNHFSDNPQNWIKVGYLGAGVFVNDQGYILTVAHLFNEFKKIEAISVTTSSDDTVAAVLKTYRTRVDLALIKTSYFKHTPYTKIADPRTLKVGQEVIAVGSPAGLSFSVSNGIISALYRDFEIAYNVTQSNAAINPGNSGGPLFNLNGELIGINSFFVMADPNYPVFSGLGFSVQSGQCIEFLAACSHKYKDLKKYTLHDKLLGSRYSF